MQKQMNLEFKTKHILSSSLRSLPSLPSLHTLSSLPFFFSLYFSLSLSSLSLCMIFLLLPSLSRFWDRDTQSLQLTWNWEVL